MTNGEMIHEFQRGRAVRFRGRACKIASLEFRGQERVKVMTFVLLPFDETTRLEEATAEECEPLRDALAA